MIEDEKDQKKSESAKSEEAATSKKEPAGKFGPKPKAGSEEKELIFEDGTAVAAEGLGIHLIQDGRRRWVPNTWTQTCLGIRWDYVVMLFPEQLLSIPEGPPMPDQAPAEPLF